ncbi:MAG TPA: hypothetical protein VFS24_18965, partial [Steroidobacteraceae bacterium]|nr:hypothetical protein [Steroidobacteraceae bacterium]
NNLKQMQSFRSEIAGASGTFSKDMERALDNSVDQVDRLKSALREAADGFLHPINEGINKSIKKLLDPKEKGGLGLSGGELIAGGGALLGFGYLAKRFGGPLLGKLLGGLGDLGVGVATGKALEQTVGVTPVYVVNMPSNGFGGGVLPGLGPIGLPGATLALPGAAVTASRVAMLARGGLGVLGAGAAGYAAGSMIYDAIDETDVADKIGAAVAHALAFFGNDAAKESLAQREKYEASLKVQIEDKRTRITHMSSSSDKLAVDATTGPMFEGHW